MLIAVYSKGMITFHIKISHVVELLLLLDLPGISSFSGGTLTL